MSIRIPFGRRVFAPSWTFTLLTILLCAVFVSLGRWQWHRGQARQAQWDEFSAGAERVLPLGSQGVDQVARFQRISLVGRFDPAHQFLLDNRMNEGRAGFEVLTPLQRPNGRSVLVDRGWVPFSGFRDHLPAVAFETHDTVTVTGRVSDLPTAGLASGRAPPPAQAPWPKVTTFPAMSQLSRALGVPLEPRIVLLDPQADHGYLRNWHPPGLEPMRNWSYALQWWCFAAVLLVLWIRLSLRKAVEQG
ncbi:MAG: SURF1 family protein [Steroidobacteraceae bacterium]